MTDETVAVLGGEETSWEGVEGDFIKTPSKDIVKLVNFIVCKLKEYISNTVAFEELTIKEMKHI